MPASKRTPLDIYKTRLAEGFLSPDEAQLPVAQKLTLLHRQLAERNRPHWQKGFLKIYRLLVGNKTSRPMQPTASMQGIYIYGRPGSGKSMLMDMFFTTAPISRKRRVHFHAFMQEVHERIYHYRQKLRQGQVADDDPIPPVADAIATQAKLLCFDEFQVKDIADASILARLFTALLARHITIVATSNMAPTDLYAGGLNRYRFLPFIDLLETRLEVLCLDALTDYRRTGDKAENIFWVVPADADARDFLDRRFAEWTGGLPASTTTLARKGRQFHIACQANGVVRFHFRDLCAANLAAGDYLALAEHYHTLIIDDIPYFSPDMRNELVRFIHLIDVLYEHKVKLLASAADKPAGLFRQTNLSPDNKPYDDKRPATSSITAGLVADFRRTVSRLTEMQTADYFARPHQAKPESGASESDKPQADKA